MQFESLTRRALMVFSHFIKCGVFLSILMPFTVRAVDLTEISETKKQALVDEIAVIVEQHGLVGLQVIITHKYGELLSLNMGLASIEKNIAVESDTLFRAGSISKTIAAIAIMQLVEREKLDLNTPVKQLAPEIVINNPWQDEAPVTLLHLMEHTAGFDDIHFQEYVVDGSQMTTKEALEFYLDSKTVRYTPGQFMSYSNVGLTLAAYIIEKFSGMSYEQYVQHYIFTPLALNTASFYLTDAVSASLASGYIAKEENKSLVSYHHLKDRAAGALNINAGELSKIQRMLLGYTKPSTTPVLEANSIAYMSTIESTLAANEGYQVGYGKYLISELTKGDIWLGHSGEMIGYLAEMWHLNHKQTGFVLLTNTASDKAKQGAQKLKQLLKSFISEIETEVHDNKADIQASYVDKPVLDYAEVVGSYRQFTSRLSRLAFFEVLETFSSVNIENNELKLTTPHSTYLLTPLGGNVFRTQLNDGHDIDIIFAKTDGDWYYQIPALFINAAKTSPLLKPLSFALLIVFFSSVLVIAMVLLIQHLLRRFLKKQVVSTKSLKWLLLSPLCLVAVIICLGSAGNSGMPLMVLGLASVQSIGVTIALLLFLSSSLIAQYNYWFFDKPMLRRSKNHYLLSFVTVFVLVNLMMLITLLWLDFIFVAFWF